MNDDELRNRLAAADPVPDDASIEPVNSASAQHLLEAIMSTHLDTPTPAPASGGEHNTRSRESRRPRWTMAVAGVAAAAVLAVGAAAIGGAFDSDDDEPDIAVDTPAEGDVLELSTGDADPTLSSCIMPDATIAGMSETAFLGTVTAIDGETVTLTVDRWYVGGDAPVVTVTAPAGFEALIGTIDFVVGDPYIISAYDGTVAYCEMSGPATPERQAWYDEAFGA